MFNVVTGYLLPFPSKKGDWQRAHRESLLGVVSSIPLLQVARDAHLSNPEGETALLPDFFREMSLNVLFAVNAGLSCFLMLVDIMRFAFYFLTILCTEKELDT